MPAKYPSSISLSFFTADVLREHMIAKHTLLLLREFAEFEPRAFQDGEQWLPIQGEVLDSVILHWMRSNTVSVQCGGPYKAELLVTTSFAASGGYNTVLFWVEEAYFEMPENTERFLNLGNKMYNLVHPVYGNIHQTNDSIAMATAHDPHYGETIVPVDLRKGLPDIYWANYFGPKYACLIGEQALRATPCDRVQEFSDGGVAVVIAPSPLTAIGEHIRSKQKAIRSYLGEDLFHHWRGSS